MWQATYRDYHPCLIGCLAQCSEIMFVYIVRDDSLYLPRTSYHQTVWRARSVSLAQQPTGMCYISTLEFALLPLKLCRITRPSLSRLEISRKRSMARWCCVLAVVSHLSILFLFTDVPNRDKVESISADDLLTLMQTLIISQLLALSAVPPGCLLGSVAISTVATCGVVLWSLSFTLNLYVCVGKVLCRRVFALIKLFVWALHWR